MSRFIKLAVGGVSIGIQGSWIFQALLCRILFSLLLEGFLWVFRVPASFTGQPVK